MTNFKTASEAVEWINGARWKGEKHGLENTRALLERLNHPERAIGRIVHVAGTNGKGSVSAFIASALMETGASVGLFTSPYLCRFNERIVLNGQPIDDGMLCDAASSVYDTATELHRQGISATTFELLTATACVYYAAAHTDYAVMEVGMGGRLDATNALPTSVSVIARIGLDHMQSLGDTVELIAAEKAGIMRSGVPAVVMPQEPGVMEVFSRIAKQVGAPYYVSDTPRITSADEKGCAFCCTLPGGITISQRVNMPGLFQADNACLALTALSVLGIDTDKAQKGISAAFWPGRLDKHQNVLIDCAHNPQGATALKEYLDRCFAGQRKVLLTGMMRDKQLEACAKIFSGFADKVVTTQVDWPRAIPAGELKQFYCADAVAESDLSKAFELAKALAGKDDLVICAGSVYLAGAVLTLLGENQFTINKNVHKQ